MQAAVLTYPKFSVIRPQGSLNAANALEIERHLTAALKLAQSLDKSLSICSVSPAIRIIFELTQLDRVFEFVKNEEELTNV